MKRHDQAFSPELEKRFRFLEEFKRIADQEEGGTDGTEGEADEDEAPALSPSSRFFLTK